MFVLVSLTLFQSTNINTPLIQRGIKLYYSYISRLPYFLFSCAAQSKSHVQKSRQSHLPVFWKFSLQNLGKSPKSLHTTSEWMNSNCHRLFSLCPLFHFCWKWGVRHSPSFAIPQLSPKWGCDFRPTFRNTLANLCGAIKQVRKCPLFRLILSFYPMDMTFEVCPFLPIVVHWNTFFRVTIGYFGSIKNLFGS